MFKNQWHISVMVVALLQARSAQAIQKIHIVNDLGKGVVSAVSMIASDGRPESLGKTDKDGQITVKKNCTEGAKLRAEPTDPLYYSDDRDCPFMEKQFVVSKKVYIHNLRANAQVLEAKGDLAEAAFAYNELAARTASVDPELARTSTEKVYTLFTAHLQKDTKSPEGSYLVKDPKQGKRLVLTAEGKKAVEGFQEAKRIEVSGTIDFETLEAASQIKLAPLLFKDKATGGTKVAIAASANDRKPPASKRR
jgi:hypothetical protein